ncbi:MAG: polyphosphate polymerase domain-containing protein [Bacteroidales bacterium]|nr:polyphosphate polymerase domain-containing protein [Bacteroidales bacterium]MDD2387879.1 polyphosphate polymerase domain-containing protein [Bacteroidales bacterium]MDD4150941.1 polyphosphate polymerase domain-containing protein [Bacteroidales bacterium]MDY0143157.1 polyphosphate polymerase domain-containing protein [Bacteroidales bacterium]
MEKINQILKSFDAVSLEDMGAVKLMNRMDSKFPFHINKLPEILNELQKDYCVLEISQKHLLAYKTMYYDSDDFICYYTHQFGRDNRFKLRTRQYVETDKYYFEVKQKNNHKKTIKTRIKIEDRNFELCPQRIDFAHSVLKKELLGFDDKLWVEFERISLVNKTFTERLTIDTGLSYRNDENEIKYPKLIILELKQNKTAKSKARKILSDNFIYQSGLSKYCLGIASLYPVKTNNMNEKFRLINKLCNENI